VLQSALCCKVPEVKYSRDNDTQHPVFNHLVIQTIPTLA
jgi:hypothetical protein